MTTRVRISNLEGNGGHALVVNLGNLHPAPNNPPPVRINPGEEHEFTVTDARFLKVSEANGLNDEVKHS